VLKVPHGYTLVSKRKFITRNTSPAPPAPPAPPANPDLHHEAGWTDRGVLRLAPGIYVNGVQQTIFNSLGLGNNSLAAGYQATVTNKDGSTTTYTVPLTDGNIYSSDIVAFLNVPTFPGGTSGSGSTTNANWVGQFLSKAWFPTTKYSYPALGTVSVTPVTPPKKVSPTPTGAIVQLPFTNSPISLGLTVWAPPPYVW
jgi:hypothetical protein